MSIRSLSRQQGFTLIELMATISLFGVFVAMAIPMYSGYIDRANINRAIGDISQVSIELYRWRTNNGGAFPATLGAAGINMDPDPWGNNYIYTDVATAAVGDLRTNGPANPVNTDFDLYSNGPDGSSQENITAAAALDDIVRANNGAFVGIAQDY